MYCYGSAITCTRFPKFFAEGKPQILPRPYFSSKPGQKGYEILRTSWMQSLVKEVGSHVLHYLHNKCEDNILKKWPCSKSSYQKNHTWVFASGWHFFHAHVCVQYRKQGRWHYAYTLWQKRHHLLCISPGLGDIWWYNIILWRCFSF